MSKTKIASHHRKALKDKLTDQNPLDDAAAMAFLASIFGPPDGGDDSGNDDDSIQDA